MHDDYINYIVVGNQTWDVYIKVLGAYFQRIRKQSSVNEDLLQVYKDITHVHTMTNQSTK